MTPERAKELLPVIQAFSEGKQVQVYDSIDKKWRNINNPTFDNPSAYRIKPEVVRYRRFIAEAGERFRAIVLNNIGPITPGDVEIGDGFVRWLGDWQEVSEDAID